VTRSGSFRRQTGPYIEVAGATPKASADAASPSDAHHPQRGFNSLAAHKQGLTRQNAQDQEVQPLAQRSHTLGGWLRRLAAETISPAVLHTKSSCPQPEPQDHRRPPGSSEAAGRACRRGRSAYAHSRRYRRLRCGSAHSPPAYHGGRPVPQPPAVLPLGGGGGTPPNLAHDWPTSAVHS